MFNENPTKLSSQNVVTQDVITAATILWLVKKLGNIYKNVILSGPILSHLPIIQITISPLSR